MIISGYFLVICIDNLLRINFKPLKFVNLLKNLSSNISSTENDVNIRIDKACTIIDWLSTI